MNQAKVVDLSGLSLNQAKKQIEGDYESIHSESIRSVFAAMARAYFQARQRIQRKSTYVGLCQISRRDLERARLLGEQLQIRGAGVLLIDQNVSPDLVEETISSVSLVGFLCAPGRLFEILNDRFIAGIRVML